MTAPTCPKNSGRFHRSQWASALILAFLVLLTSPGECAVLDSQGVLIPELDGNVPTGREVASTESFESELLETIGEDETEKELQLIRRAAGTSHHRDGFAPGAGATIAHNALLRYAPKQDPPLR